MRVLVVEDDENLSQVIQRGLSEEGYAVDAVSDGLDGEYLAGVNPYDLIVLDWMLPGQDGLQLCLKLRQRKIATPILMLTAKDAPVDRIKGLDSGADDYLTKPFFFGELTARLRALLRRHAPVKTNRLEMGDLALDLNTRQAERAGQSIELTTKEYALLEFMLRHPQQVLTHQAIQDHVWNFEALGESNLIAVYIRRLRRKLDDPFATRMLETVKGSGYRLVWPGAPNSTRSDNTGSSDEE